MVMIRRFSDLRRMHTFEERYDYLRLQGEVGYPTFGSERYINQRFYRSLEWKNIRNDVIARDEGCDLGIEGFEIFERPLVHHMNPMRVKDIAHSEDYILDPEFLITVSHQTHNAIHYGDRTSLRQPEVDRRPGDTKLW